MTQDMSVADVLERAADLLARPNGWTQNTYARRADGTKTDTIADDATCFCLAGAIAHEFGESLGSAMRRTMEVRKAFIVPLTGKAVASWNDAPGRQKSEVVAMLRKAAAKARQS